MEGLALTYDKADKAWSHCVNGRYGRSKAYAVKAARHLAEAIARLESLKGGK